MEIRRDQIERAVQGANKDQRDLIERAVARALDEYGETFRLLAEDDGEPRIACPQCQFEMSVNSCGINGRCTHCGFKQICSAD